jgi:hypothetical protein
VLFAYFTYSLFLILKLLPIPVNGLGLIIVPVALNRAKETGLSPSRSSELPANTILVVFAAKVIKKLVLQLLA